MVPRGIQAPALHFTLMTQLGVGFPAAKPQPYTLSYIAYSGDEMVVAKLQSTLCGALSESEISLYRFNGEQKD